MGTLPAGTPNRLPRDMRGVHLTPEEIGAARLDDGSMAVVITATDVDGKLHVLGFTTPEFCQWIAERFIELRAVAWPGVRP